MIVLLWTTVLENIHLFFTFLLSSKEICYILMEYEGISVFSKDISLRTSRKQKGMVFRYGFISTVERSCI